VKETCSIPSYTTKPAGELHWLGPVEHDSIVKQQRGKIDVDTEPGAFTDFIITLPRPAASTMVGGQI